ASAGGGGRSARGCDRGDGRADGRAGRCRACLWGRWSTSIHRRGAVDTPGVRPSDDERHHPVRARVRSVGARVGSGESPGYLSLLSFSPSSPSMSPASTPAPVILLVLDGWGYRAEREGNAIAMAAVRTWDRLWAGAPRTLLEASGEAVGLP